MIHRILAGYPRLSPLVFLFFLVLVASCLPASGRFEGNGEFVITPAAPGPAATGAEPREALLCYSQPSQPIVDLALGPECVLHGSWKPERFGGTAVFAAHQRCAVPLRGRRAALDLTYGFFRLSGQSTIADLGLIEGSIAGTTIEGPSQYVVLRFSLAGSMPMTEDQCHAAEAADHGSPPAAGAAATQ
jgi:hypothetical protein